MHVVSRLRSGWRLGRELRRDLADHVNEVLRNRKSASPRTTPAFEIYSPPAPHGRIIETDDEYLRVQIGVWRENFWQTIDRGYAPVNYGFSSLENLWQRIESYLRARGLQPTEFALGKVYL